MLSQGDILEIVAALRDRQTGCPHAKAENPYGCTGDWSQRCGYCLTQILYVAIQSVCVDAVVQFGAKEGL